MLAETWRDYDPGVRELPGMALGAHAIEGCDVAALYDAGVRFVRLAEEVDLGAAAGPLILLRELTGRSIAVEWTARCDDPDRLRRLTHLYPPSTVVGPVPVTDALRAWWERFFPCKCVFRAGPGFIEVRDRRYGNLELFTIDEPDHLRAVRRLAEGVPAGELDPALREELAAADLIADNGGVLWWLPMRLHRWPFQPLAV